MPQYRSHTSTHGRNMAGARALWRATGVKEGDFGKPIIAVVNSFTQFVPGHVHLKDMGQLVAREIEAAGGVAKDGKTPKDTVIVFSYKTIVNKVDANQKALTGAAFTLHYCTRSAERTAFAAEIAASPLAPHTHIHHDDGAPAQKLDLPAVLAAPADDKRLYVCGPAGFIDHVVNTAKA